MSTTETPRSKNRRPVTTLTSRRAGRPKAIRRQVERLIGTAGLAALEAAGLRVVPEHIHREFCLMAGEPPAPSLHSAPPPDA